MFFGAKFQLEPWILLLLGVGQYQSKIDQSKRLQSVISRERIRRTSWRCISCSWQAKVKRNSSVITHDDGSRGGGRFSLLFVCLFFHTMSQKPTQLGSPNLAYDVPRRVLKKHLFWGQNVKGQGYESTGVCLCTLASACFF